MKSSKNAIHVWRANHSPTLSLWGYAEKLCGRLVLTKGSQYCLTAASLRIARTRKESRPPLLVMNINQE
ncbi:hypothetical protein N9B10_02970 [Pirellulales bacterium]|nr:hypothetical protein [Pirellulales bacterium]